MEALKSPWWYVAVDMNPEPKRRGEEGPLLVHDKRSRQRRLLTGGAVEEQLEASAVAGTHEIGLAEERRHVEGRRDDGRDCEDGQHKEESSVHLHAVSEEESKRE